MHEMSIAEGILDVALDTLRQHDASVIRFLLKESAWIVIKHFL